MFNKITSILNLKLRRTASYSNLQLKHKQLICISIIDLVIKKRDSCLRVEYIENVER